MMELKSFLKKFSKLSANQWDEKIHYRGLHIKYKHQLQQLINLYPKKIKEVKSKLDLLDSFIKGDVKFNKIGKILEIFPLDICEERTLKELKELALEEVEERNGKITRLIDKYAATTKEIELRVKKQVKRTPIGTTYYIDLNAGNDGAAGTAIGTAWLTIAKYTTVTARTAGDIAKVRANTSQILAADVAMDEDGDSSNYIEIRGCSIADDPWSDVSDVKPIFDFNSTAKQFWANFSRDDYWKFNNLEIKNSTDSTGAIGIQNTAKFWLIVDCTFTDNVSGVCIDLGDGILIKNCIFSGNTSNGIRIGISNLRYTVIGCTFNGGNYGIYDVANSGHVVIIDCSFGQTVVHNTADVYLKYIAESYFRNCKWDKGITVYSTYAPIKRIHHEDYNQVFEANKFLSYDATIERETTVVRAGGADTSIKLTPGQYIGEIRPATIMDNRAIGAFKVWLAASVEKTITIYIRGFGWTGFPTAAQLFLRASYLSNGASAARTEIDSNDVLADNVNWVGFDVTLTPARTGFVYLDVFMAHYEAASGIYIDLKPVIS